MYGRISEEQWGTTESDDFKEKRLRSNRYMHLHYVHTPWVGGSVMEERTKILLSILYLLTIILTYSMTKDAELKMLIL